jgi:ribosomal protein L40E
MKELGIGACYIARHYGRLWSTEEAQAAEAFALDGTLKEMQDDAESEKMRTGMADDLQLRLRDPRVAEQFQKGREGFYRDLVVRLLRDHPNELPICPRCNWLLPTGRAKQCSKCGHDWHQPSNELPWSPPSAGG